MIDKFKESNPKVVEELIPNALSLGKVQKVLQNLLKEQISIRDLRTILEQLADSAISTQGHRPAHRIRAPVAGPPDHQAVPVHRRHSVGADPWTAAVEDVIEGSIQKTETVSYLALEPNVAEKLLTRLKETMEAIAPRLESLADSARIADHPPAPAPFHRTVSAGSGGVVAQRSDAVGADQNSGGCELKCELDASSHPVTAAR